MQYKNDLPNLIIVIKFSQILHFPDSKKIYNYKEFFNIVQFLSTPRNQ
jgi:hypothetical protein